MDIRYRDILMKSDKRDAYKNYYDRLSKQYSSKKTSIKTNKYYNIDKEFNNFNDLVRDKIKFLKGLRDNLLYEDKIDSQDSQRYDKEKAEFLELNTKLEKFKNLKEQFYKDTENNILKIKEKLVDLRKELRILFLTFKSKDNDSGEWNDDINNYLKKKKEIDNLNKTLQKNIDMSSYPKYYLKTSIQVSTVPSTTQSKVSSYTKKKKRRTKSKHKKSKKSQDTKGLKSKKKKTKTMAETF